MHDLISIWKLDRNLFATLKISFEVSPQRGGDPFGDHTKAKRRGGGDDNDAETKSKFKSNAEPDAKQESSSDPSHQSGGSKH